jgi:O-antigen/teichoic acid export membrane protein
VGEDTLTSPPLPAGLTIGSHEQHLAIGSLAQQASQAVATLASLVSITVLARHLSLGEFGTYGLLVSLTTYVFFLQGSVETAAIRAVAESQDQVDRDRAFSTAIALYVGAGLLAGSLVAGVGTALLGLFHIAPGLHHQARLSVLALAVVICAGWPLKVYNDVLRGTQKFVISALVEIVSYVAVAALVVGLALGGASLWLLVATGAMPALLIGVSSAVAVLSLRLPFHYRRHAVTTATLRGFLGISSYLSLIGLTGLVIYSLGRTILAAFRSAATVGLYEGPVRAHNLVQQVHSALSVPALPAASRFAVEHDIQRMHHLVLRGTRYTLAVVVPLTIVIMALARPILHVWLGQRFVVATTAMTLLVGYWLVNANTGVASGMLVAVGRVRQLTGYAAAVALLNLGLSLALTPSLGLNGVVLGTTISYLLAFPFFLRVVLKALPVTLGQLAREAWLPAYTTGAVLAIGLVGARVALPLHRLPEVLATGFLGLAVYWGIYYTVWLRPNERRLLRNVALVIVRR